MKNLKDMTPEERESFLQSLSQSQRDRLRAQGSNRMLNSQNDNNNQEIIHDQPIDFTQNQPKEEPSKLDFVRDVFTNYINKQRNQEQQNYNQMAKDSEAASNIVRKTIANQEIKPEEQQAYEEGLARQSQNALDMASMGSFSNRARKAEDVMNIFNQAKDNRLKRQIGEMVTVGKKPIVNREEINKAAELYKEIQKRQSIDQPTKNEMAGKFAEWLKNKYRGE